MAKVGTMLTTHLNNVPSYCNHCYCSLPLTCFRTALSFIFWMTGKVTLSSADLLSQKQGDLCSGGLGGGDWGKLGGKLDKIYNWNKIAMSNVIWKRKINTTCHRAAIIVLNCNCTTILVLQRHNGIIAISTIISIKTKWIFCIILMQER